MREGDVDFTVDKVLTNPDGADVYCSVKVKMIEQNVDDKSKGGVKAIFSLVKIDGKIKVRDLKIEESSFLNAYRDRFYKMIHEDSDDEIDWFLEDLETIVEDNEEKFERKDE